jgi:hypothetical protein
MNKKDIKQFKMKTKSLEYTVLRSAPKIEGVVESCSKMELSTTDFPFIDPPKNMGGYKPKNYGGNMFGGDQEDDDSPYLIVFMLGGLAHNEICALERLSLEKRIAHSLVLGSTSITTANDFVFQLSDLSAPQDVSSDNIKKVDLTDIELGMMK